MKKVFLIGLIGLSIAHAAATADNKALLAKVFPSGGWGACSKEKGMINFKELAALEGTPAGKSLIDTKIAAMLKDCPFAKNPNFSASVQAACTLHKDITNSENKKKLCGDPLNGALNITANKAKMDKAFPTKGFGSCAADKGNLDFLSIADLEKTDAGKALVNAKVTKDIVPCNNSKNPNFQAKLKAACTLAANVVSATKNTLCGMTPPATTTAATDPYTQAATTNTQPVVGTVIDPNTQSVATPVVQGIVVDTKALMAKTFPQKGWGTCAKEKGSVDFVSMAELEKSPEGKVLVDAKVDLILKDCPFAKNPNFSASMQVACSTATDITSSNKDKLCGASPVKGNDSTALLKKAFPEPAFSMACSEGRGALDFNAVALLEASNPTALMAKQKETIACANDTKKNPKFVKALTNACNSSSTDSNAKADICKTVGIGVALPIAPAPDVPPAQPDGPAPQVAAVPAPVDNSALEAVINEMQAKIASLEAENATLKAQLKTNSEYIRDQVMPYMKSVYDYIVQNVTPK